MKIKIGINGMGRIGRMIVRSIIENKYSNIEIRHINNRTNSETCSNLLKYDSIHGKFDAEIKFDENHLIINKNMNWPEINKNYLGDLLERILCRVLLCILSLRAVSETFLLHNSKTLCMCSHLTLSADIGFSGGIAFDSGAAKRALSTSSASAGFGI